jgi:hypothetical protein
MIIGSEVEKEDLMNDSWMGLRNSFCLMDATLVASALQIAASTAIELQPSGHTYASHIDTNPAPCAR